MGAGSRATRDVEREGEDEHARPTSDPAPGTGSPIITYLASPLEWTTCRGGQVLIGQGTEVAVDWPA